MRHCWQGKLEWVDATYGRESREWWAVLTEETGSTCLLPDGHAGPHVWTPDDMIRVEFPKFEQQD